MKDSKMIFNQIKQLTNDLVSISLCDDQNFPVLRGTLESCSIEIDSPDVSTALKNIPYHEMYEEMCKKRSYNIKMIDGALLILQYRVEDNNLVGHRLCFFPNPNLSEFQNNPDIFWEDDIYLDIIDPRIVVVPIRFDFDCREDVVKEIDHPVSHLTLGQYSNCRIPVARPLTPYHFISFIIRNFYHTAYTKFCDNLSQYSTNFSPTIAPSEKNIIHIGLE